MIQNLGKGCQADTPDSRDYQAIDVMGGAPVIDWSVEFRLPEPPDTDQGQSDACVGHASSYYHWQLEKTRFAVRSVFAYIALAYGASIRDGVKQVATAGQQTYNEIPDPSPETPQNMRDKTGLDPSKAIQHTELNYYVLPNQQLDYLAQAIRVNNGFQFGVQGTNSGWSNLLVPNPPQFGTNETIWGHSLYAFGYHTHSDGQKCIICKSSWCNEVKEHHIRETYFTSTSGNTFNAWVLIPRKKNIMFELVVKQDGTTYGVRVATPNGDQIIYATDENQFRSWNKPDSYALPTINADGTTNWTNNKAIKLPW